MESSDSPDSTVNTELGQKIPPLNFIGGGKSSLSTKNNSLISRLAYNAASNSYRHLPPGNNNSSSNSSESNSNSSSVNNKTIMIPSRTNLENKLSYVFKGMSSTSETGGSSSVPSTNNKTTYGSQSRTSMPVRNFLRPSLISKFSKTTSRVFTSSTTASSSVGVSSAPIKEIKEKRKDTVSTSSKLKANHEVVESSSFRSNNSRPSSSVSSTYITTSTEAPNRSLKLHIRRNPDAISSPNQNETHQQQLIVEPLNSPTTSWDTISNVSPSDATNMKRTVSDIINARGDSSPGSSCSNTNSIYLSSSCESSPVTPVTINTKQQHVVSTSHSTPEKPNISIKLTKSSVNSTPCVTTTSRSSVIRQLHPELLKQVQKQVNDKVVEIDIDMNTANHSGRETATASLCNNSNSKSNNHCASSIEDSIGADDPNEEMDEEDGDEEDEASNSESTNTNMTSDSHSRDRDNTITIMIGDEGVISETGDNAVGGLLSGNLSLMSNDDDSRRTKRKRKPTKHFMPDLIVPRLKIRRKKDEPELDGSGTASEGGASILGFSFETVDSKEKGGKHQHLNIVGISDDVPINPNGNDHGPQPPIDLTPVVKKPGRGRPRGSGNRAKADIPPKPPGTGRGRGRPRGSTNKNKLERERLKAMAAAAAADIAAAASETEADVADVDVVTPIDSTLTVSSTVVPVTTNSVSTTTPTATMENGDLGSPEILLTPIIIPPESTVVEEPSTQVSTTSNSDTTLGSGSTPKTRGRGAPRGNKGPRMRGGARGGARRVVKPRKPRQKKEKVEDKAPKIVSPTPVQVFEEETRMSADVKPPPIIPPISDSEAILDPEPAAVQLPIDEESVGASNVSSTSTSVTGTTKMKKFTKDLVPDRKPVTAETLYEYCWPATDSNGEMFMLQEQISEYLGVKSFKRKYPDLKRRFVDMEERDFLRLQKTVSETQCDLGLTALSSSDVLDIMFNDFPEKYEEYTKTIQERKEKELAKIKGATPTAAPPVRDRTAEFYRRCLKSTAKWNATLNRQRKEERSCSFDLQTFTLHYQQGKMKVLPPEATKIGHYPVTVLPGQYCDNYKSFTPAELKYLPLNTVLYGPVVSPQQVDEAEWQSDNDVSSSSDYSSSSDDSSSSSEDESPDPSLNLPKCNGEKQNGVDHSPSVVRTCKACEGDAQKNKVGQPETLLHCTKCDVPNHPTCLELRVDMLPFIKKYNWQCTDCKNCIECNDPADEDKMLFCDLCDRGYHIYCVGLRKVPTGRWHCRVCSVCFSCGCTQPSPEDRLAEWHHEFRKGEKNSRHFTHSLCTSCHKLYKKGQFCPSCLKVHLKVEDNKNLSECRSCEKWVHRDCIKRPLQSMFGFMCDPCDAAFRTKTKLPSHVN